VIEGRVTWADDTQSPRAGTTAGIVIIATHHSTGERRELTTFSDGSFYAMGVRPGEWSLAIQAECLELLKAGAEPVGFTIRADDNGDSVSGLELTLR
jgi:hypothetical protein